MEIESYPDKTTGAYTFAEAARILLAAGAGLGDGDVCSRLRYWVNSGVVYDGLVRDTGRDRLIHFQALVSLRVVAALWGQGVDLRAIRRGERVLREGLGVAWPFIAESFWRRKGAAFQQFAELIAASKGGAEAVGFLSEWLSENVGGIKFNEYGMAYAWLPARNIVIDGRIVSGQPCIAWRRTPVWVVHSLFEQGESIADIAYDYGFTEDKVKDAVAWGKRVASAAI